MKIFKYFGREDLLFKWLNRTDKILDMGCAYGEYTKLYSEKCNMICGLDPNEELLRMARRDYPKIEFKRGIAEDIPFENELFDVVILADVLEHVNDEKKTLEEIRRVLKKGGDLLLTVPNKGLFSFMDIDNYSWYYRKFRNIKTNKPGYQNKHKHYSFKELKKLLEPEFQILKSYRSSLFLLPFVSNLLLLIRLVFGRNIELKLRPFLYNVGRLDFSIPYGRYSYCMGICAKKN
tara:strand:- start:58 stop:759 length:702 start_codon:yes stop_codon:yes gene_type:complete